MKSLILSLIAQIICIVTFSQSFDIKSFEKLKDMDARINHPKTDMNGDKCAIIKVVTNKQGFIFEGDALGVIDVIRKVGEYWVYIPHGAKRLIIKHDKLGVLRYVYEEPIEVAVSYELVLISGKIKTIVEDDDFTEFVVIESTPSGADVYIDDIYKGQTPVQAEEKFGKHTLKLEHDMYKVEIGTFIIEKGEGYKKHFELVPMYGSLFVTSDPLGAEIILNSNSTGKLTPHTFEKLIAGKQLVKLRKKWYAPEKREVELLPGKKIDVSLDMKNNSGILKIEATNSAGIYVNNNLKGEGKIMDTLISGTYVVEARKYGYHSYKDIVDINAGDEKFLNLKLNPVYGRVKIISNPISSVVYLNGEKIGTTPLKKRNVLIGKYIVRISKPGYDDITKELEVFENRVSELNVNLTSVKEILINSKPQNAKVYINGELIGNTPLKRVLSNTKHKIIVKNNTKSDSLTVDLSTTDRKEFNFNVEIAPEVNIPIKPKDEEIVVDGKLIDTRKKHFIQSYSAIESPVGVRVGRLSKVGYYASINVSSYIFKNKGNNGEFENGFIKTENRDNNIVTSVNSEPGSVESYNISLGLTSRLSNNLFINYGAGYGVYRILYKFEKRSANNFGDNTELLLVDSENSYENFLIESGVILRFGNFMLSTGISTILFEKYDFNFGIGINF